MKRFLIGMVIFILSITTFTFSPRDAHADVYSPACRSFRQSHVVSVFPNQNNFKYFQAPANEMVNGTFIVGMSGPVELAGVTVPIDNNNRYTGFQMASTPSWLRVSGNVQNWAVSGVPPASEAGKCYGLIVRANGVLNNNTDFAVIVEGNPYPGPNPTYPGPNPTYPGPNPTYPGPNPYQQNNQPPRAAYNRTSHTWVPEVQRTIGSYFIDDERDPLTYSMSGNPSWLQINPSIGEVYGTAPASAGGQSYTITVYATDNKPGHSPASFTFTLNIQSNNHPPTVSPSYINETATEGISFSKNLSGFFSDRDGDRLNYQFGSGSHPYWLNLSSTGVLSGVPDASAAGRTFNFTVIANDGKGGKANLTVSIVVKSGNSPPTVNPSNISETATVGISFSKDLSGFFSDRDGDRLNYQLSGSYPSWLNLNSSTGVLSGVPSANGNFNFTVTAKDGKGGVANLTVEIQVRENQPPRLKPGTSLPSSITQGQPISINLSDFFEDPENRGIQQICVRRIFIPSGLSLEGDPSPTGERDCRANAVIKGCADNDGSVNIPIKVIDVDGKTFTARWNLTVNPGSGRDPSCP